jgi:hypothetical protein
MSCGGDGHILLSDAIAGRLGGLEAWRGKLHDLGEYVAKNSIVHVWRFTDGAIGSTAALTAPSKKAAMMRRTAFGIVGVGVVGGAGAYVWRQPGMNLPERSFTYSIVLKEAGGQMRELGPAEAPPSGSSIKINFSSPQNGFLYIVAEGPATQSGQNWIWLFPELDSIELAPETSLAIPTPPEYYIQLDSQPGRETFHLLWSEKALEPAEAIHNRVVSLTRDTLSAGEAATMSRLMSEAAQATKEKASGKSTLMRGRGSTITASITLAHM